MTELIKDVLRQHPADAFTVRAVATYLGIPRHEWGLVARDLYNLSHERGSGVRYLGRSGEPGARHTDMYTYATRRGNA